MDEPRFAYCTQCGAQTGGRFCAHCGREVPTRPVAPTRHDHAVEGVDSAVRADVVIPAGPQATAQPAILERATPAITAPPGGVPGLPLVGPEPIPSETDVWPEEAPPTGVIESLLGFWNGAPVLGRIAIAIVSLSLVAILTAVVTTSLLERSGDTPAASEEDAPATSREDVATAVCAGSRVEWEGNSANCKTGDTPAPGVNFFDSPAKTQAFRDRACGSWMNQRLYTGESWVAYVVTQEQAAGAIQMGGWKLCL